MEQNRSYLVAVIGDRDSVLGFRAVGFDVHFAEEPQDAGILLKKLVRDGKYAIIYITEPLFTVLSELIETYRDLTLPAIIVIPSVSENSGVGIRRIQNSVERAVGADILFKE